MKLGPDAIVQEIADLFAKRGDSDYGGEAVSQLDHALQAASLAEAAGEPATLIVAALLHDIGHLLHDLPSDAPTQAVDDRHELGGEAYLSQHFPDSVVAPVRMHVAAKRYLCAVEPEYLRGLSEPSIQSLKLQGGVMSPHQVADFESEPHAMEAVKLRRWDDAAKVVELVTPELEHFLPYLGEVLSLQKDG